MQRTSRSASVLLTAALGLVAAGCCFGDAQVSPTPAVAPAPVATTPAVPGEVPAIGTPVLAEWETSGFYFLGVVIGTEGELLRIMYADGTTATVATGATLPDRLVPGIAIDAHQYGETEFRSGTLGGRTGHAVLVTYADGQNMWTSVGFVRARRDALPAAAVEPTLPAVALGEPGSQVLARYTDDHYYSAVVIDRAASGNPRVIYADGEGQEITLDRLRPDTLTTGAAVEVRDRLSGATLAGSVVRRVAHAVEVRLADGSSRWFALCDARLPAA